MGYLFFANITFRISFSLFFISHLVNFKGFRLGFLQLTNLFLLLQCRHQKDKTNYKKYDEE